MRARRFYSAVALVPVLGLLPCIAFGISFTVPDLPPSIVNATSRGDYNIRFPAVGSSIQTSAAESTAVFGGGSDGRTSVMYQARASGGISPSVWAYAAAGNVAGPGGLGLYPEGHAFAQAEVDYLFLVGSDADFPAHPGNVSIFFNYSQSTRGFLHYDYLPPSIIGETRVEVISGGTVIFADWLTGSGVNANQDKSGNVNLNVPFDEWIQVHISAKARADDAYGWTGLAAAADITAFVDPTITIDPNFPNAGLFFLRQASVAPLLAVPEPSTLVLLGLGLIALAAARGGMPIRRRKPS